MALIYVVGILVLNGLSQDGCWVNEAHGRCCQSAGDTTLPPELLQEIFVNLPAHQVVRVCPLVCREWRALVNSECLWKERCRREGYKSGDEAGQDVVKGWKMFYFLSKDKRNLLKNTKAEGETPAL